MLASKQSVLAIGSLIWLLVCAPGKPHAQSLLPSEGSVVFNIEVRFYYCLLDRSECLWGQRHKRNEFYYLSGGYISKYSGSQENSRWNLLNKREANLETNYNGTRRFVGVTGNSITDFIEFEEAGFSKDVYTLNSGDCNYDAQTLNNVFGYEITKSECTCTYELHEGNIFE